MDHLLKIVQSAEPAAGVQFRNKAYGKDEIRRFLRDIVALANARRASGVDAGIASLRSTRVRRRTAQRLGRP